MPQMAESISEVTLRSWSKNVGDSLVQDEGVTIETDKVCTALVYPTAYTRRLMSMRLRTRPDDPANPNQGTPLHPRPRPHETLRLLGNRNASIQGDKIVYRYYVDLSVAVATSKGLVTPFVRNAEGKILIEIKKEIATLGKKVRMLYLIRFACINGFCSANTGMHAIKDRPVVVNGQIVVRPIMVVALT